MHHSHATRQYNNLDLQTRTENASPHQLVQMLFGGALVRIKAAMGHMERKEIAQKAELIGKAIAIIDGLRGSLNMEQGGPVASNLDDLYLYINKQLLLANLQNDEAKLHEVCQLLEDIKSAWDALNPTK